MPETIENPYIGPSPFSAEYAHLFFGREREAQHLVSLVISDPIVLFYAQSGAGKTSLINTRLIPGLRNEGFFVFPVGRVGGQIQEGTTDVENPFTNNLLLKLNPEYPGGNSLTNLSLSEYLDKHKKTSQLEGVSRVLIIDQFEEILNTHLDQWHKREDFIADLGDAVRRDENLWVVLSMREEFMPSLDPYISHLPGKTRSRFYMQRMGVEAAIEAVEKPVAELGWSYAPDVAKKIVDNLRQLNTEVHTAEPIHGQFVEPVQLQIVCQQLWNNLKPNDSKRITNQDLVDLGDIDNALIKFYEESISEVLDGDKILEFNLRNWFDRRLITESNTRGIVYQGTSKTSGMDNEIVENLKVLRQEKRARGVWYELIHDRFVQPIQLANARWRNSLPQLLQDADAWDLGGQQPRDLYAGKQLQDALVNTDLISTYDIVREFIQSSREAENQRALAKTRRKIKEDKKQADEEAKRARRLRKLSIWLFTAFVFAIIASATASFLTVQIRDNELAANIGSTRSALSEAAYIEDIEVANRLRQTAEAASDSAVRGQATAEFESNRAGIAKATADAAIATSDAARVAAEAAATQAVQEKLLADSQRLTAEAQRLTAEAAELFAEVESREQLAQSLLLGSQNIMVSENNAELGTLLAMEAYHISDGIDNSELRMQAANTLSEFTKREFFNTSLRVVDAEKNTINRSAIRAIDFAPNRDLLVAVSEDGLIYVWSLNGVAGEYQIHGRHQGAVNGIEFFDEDRFVTIGDDRRLMLWSLETPNSPLETIEFSSPVLYLSTSSTEAQAAVSLQDGSLFLVDFSQSESKITQYLSQETPQAPRPILLHIYNSTPTLSAANPDGSVQRWALNNRFSPFQKIFPIVSREAITVIVSRNEGMRVFGNVYAATSGEIVISRETGLDVFILKERHAGPVNGLSLSENGLRMASAGSDGTVRLWQVPDDQEDFRARLSAVLYGHQGSVLDLDFSPNENFLATAGSDGIIYLWWLVPRTINLVPGGNVEGNVCGIIGRNMSIDEWGRFLPSEPYNCTCEDLPSGIGAQACEENVSTQLPLLAYVSLPLIIIIVWIKDWKVADLHRV